MFVRRYLPRSPLPAPHSPFPSPLPSPLLPPRLTFYHSSLLNTKHGLLPDARPTAYLLVHDLLPCTLPSCCAAFPLSTPEEKSRKTKRCYSSPLSPPLPSSSLLTKFYSLEVDVEELKDQIDEIEKQRRRGRRHQAPQEHGARADQA